MKFRLSPQELAKVLLKDPAIVVCAVLNNVTPSPELKLPPGKPLFNGATL